MSKTLIVVFGANGGVASMLMPYLNKQNNILLVTCGSKAWREEVTFFSWSFDQPSPIPKILLLHPEYESIVVLYSAIYWPKSEADLEANFQAFKLVIDSLPEGVRLISISSFVAATQANSLYARLKRGQESLCQSHQCLSLRLGMIDAKTPFGQSMMFIQLAKLLHVVPVPFWNAKVVISSEEDILQAILDIIDHVVVGSGQVIEVKTLETTFIEAVRGILNKTGLKYVCIPIPNFVTHSFVNLVFRLTPHSWLAERLQGLKAFATS